MQRPSRTHREITSKDIPLMGACVIIFGSILLSGWHPGPNPHKREATCSSNEKQIGLALLQYAEDNDQSLPVGLAARGQTGSSRPGMGWAGQIASYLNLGDRNTFRCPEDDTGDSIISYGYNSNAAGGITALKGTSGSFGSFTDPARTVAVFEVTDTMADMMLSDEGASQGALRFSPVGDGTDGGLHSVYSGLDKARYATGFMGRPAAATGRQFASAKGRHIGGSNFLFADGHVKWFRPLTPISTGDNASSSMAAQTGSVTGTAAGTANTAFDGTFSVK